MNYQSQISVKSCPNEIKVHNEILKKFHYINTKIIKITSQINGKKKKGEILNNSFNIKKKEFDFQLPQKSRPPTQTKPLNFGKSKFFSLFPASQSPKENPISNFLSSPKEIPSQAGLLLLLY